VSDTRQRNERPTTSTGTVQANQDLRKGERGNEEGRRRRRGLGVGREGGTFAGGRRGRSKQGGEAAEPAGIRGVERW
jgi:hypothetical protein